MVPKITYFAWLNSIALCAAAVALDAASRASEIAVKRSVGGAVVTIDDQPMAEYLVESGHQPVIWPIMGPGGQAMTRQFPLGARLASERGDHPHHRSLWFSHGLVNDLDFWMSAKSGNPGKKDNRIEHREFIALASQGVTARIVARNDWTSEGSKVCEDVRTIIFGADARGRWIDFAVEIRATQSELTFGDTEEGTLGLRVPGTMDVDARKGGQIVNSRGQSNKQAWGHAAEWIDYHGPVDGNPAGIAIFSLPDSFRHPCRWHVRTYGLVAANPFGERGFPPADVQQGQVKIAKGEKLRLHYRVLFYSGERSPEQLDAIYKLYASTAKPRTGSGSAGRP